MRRLDAEYYERRAARERALAARALPYFAAQFLATAEQLERRAALCRGEHASNTSIAARVAGDGDAAG